MVIVKVKTIRDKGNSVSKNAMSENNHGLGTCSYEDKIRKKKKKNANRRPLKPSSEFFFLIL